MKTYILIAVIVIVLFIVMKYVENNQGKGKKESKPIDNIEDKDINVTYLSKDILSPAEMKFYYVLVKAKADTYLEIWPKMSIREMIDIKDSEGKTNRTKFLNKIDRKHIDFTLVNPKSGKPLLCIELDDKSHQKQDRKERDLFVDNVMKQAGIKLIHVPAAIEYDIENLKMIIKNSLPQ